MRSINRKQIWALICLSAFLGLTACHRAGEANALLKQQYSDDRDAENRQSGEFLFQLAQLEQPSINQQFHLKTRHADFYIGCMQGTSNPKMACEALYVAMAKRAQTLGKPDVFNTRSYVGLTAKDIQDRAMWKVLGPEVIDDNNERIAWEGH